MLNGFFYRNSQDSVKLCTLSDMMERAGNRESGKLAAASKKPEKYMDSIRKPCIYRTLSPISSMDRKVMYLLHWA